MSADSAAV